MTMGAAMSMPMTPTTTTTMMMMLLLLVVVLLVRRACRQTRSGPTCRGRARILRILPTDRAQIRHRPRRRHA
jgi:hypothetical protein